MAFWAYMLHCRGGSFYAGHTDDLKRRIGEHRSGLIPGFTADRLPVELVWSEEFAHREDAKVAERRIKGWSRAKKLALIRGDWARISELAYGGKNQDGPSTSSGRTACLADDNPKPDNLELVEGRYFSLTSHHAHAPQQVTEAAVKLLSQDAHWLTFRWRIERTAALVVPPFAGRRRADGLWRTTCFELFVAAPEGEGYSEFNFSPSEAWAAYDFTAYREGMAERAMPRAPIGAFRPGAAFALFEAAIARAALPPHPARIGLSAVIEEQGGVKSYWALAHPRADAPDFHHRAGFTASLG